MKLLLIDLSHIFHTRWHATAGQDIDAAFRSSYAAVRELKDGFDATVICCDSGKCWRHEVYPQYKAGRTPLEEAGKDQLRRLREQLAADGLPVIDAPGYEADDIIATLACKAPGEGYEVTIATGDKDLSQLIGPSIVVRSTNNGGGLIGPDQVREKFGVGPNQLGDWLALVGDKSDNVTGCPGCGPKNATRLLNELGSLANMLEAIDGVTPPSIRDALREHKQEVLLARKLVQLRTDVPLDFAEAIKPREPSAPPAKDDAPDADEVKESPVVATGPVTGNGSGSRASADPKQAGDGGGDGPAPVTSALVLDRQDPSWMLSLEPRGLRQLQWFAEKLFSSMLYRKFPNPDAIMAVILRGRSMGIDMMTALDGFHVIEGKPGMSAMLAVATVLNSGKAEYFELVESTNERATWETLRKGGRGKPLSLTYSIDDAQRAGLVRPGSNWIKHPRPMCRKQAGIELARAAYPDVISNLYDPDEFVSA